MSKIKNKQNRHGVQNRDVTVSKIQNRLDRGHEVLNTDGIAKQRREEGKQWRTRIMS